MAETEIVTSDENKQLDDAMVNKKTTFHGNPLLKKENEEVALTEEHIDELVKCMNDPIYFAERYVQIVNVDKGLIPIQLYDYQKKMIKAMNDHRYSIILSCRQSGKCVTGDTKITVQNDNYNDGKPFEIEIEKFMELINANKT